MTSRSRARSVVFLLLGAMSLAFLVDRIALYTWGLSVLRQFQRYRQSASPSVRLQPSVSISDVTEPPLWIGPITSPRSSATDGHGDRVRVLISFEPALARPDSVFVKGHIVELLYLPPALAWTTRIFPLRPHGLPYRLYRPKDHYGYRIAADFSGVDDLPVFKVYRVTNFNEYEIPADTRLPELFP